VTSVIRTGVYVLPICWAYVGTPTHSADRSVSRLQLFNHGLLRQSVLFPDVFVVSAHPREGMLPRAASIVGRKVVDEG